MLLMSMLLAAAAPRTNADIKEDIGAALKTANARLNAQYQATLAQAGKLDAGGPQPDATTGPSYRQAVVNAERAWIAFRDANCLAEGYQYRGGSAQIMVQGQCVLDMTRARTKELATLRRSLAPL